MSTITSEVLKPCSCLVTIITALTQGLSVCCSFLIQQVGVQCYERGALLTQIWNLYTELMDMKFADMREAVVSAESLRVKVGILIKGGSNLFS